jgi:hypothetical protein
MADLKAGTVYFYFSMFVIETGERQHLYRHES